MILGVATLAVAAAVGLFAPTSGREPSDAQIQVAPDPGVLAFFKPDYESSRAAFRAAAAECAARYAGVEAGALAVPSRTDSDLTIDYVHVPAQRDPQGLLILCCGIHGIEGPVGSAVARHFLSVMMPARDLSNLGVLVLHAINPYGFKHGRRVTETNVDLNRNFEVEDSLFALKNEGYRNIRSFLNPDGAANPRSLGNRYFPLTAARRILVSGEAALRQATVEGQYEFPTGIFFGGNAFEPQKALLEPLLIRVAKPYREVLAIDFHTGYGERGRLHLFPNPAARREVREATERIFAGHPIDWGDSSGEYYQVHGEFAEYLARVIGPERLCIPMTFEYGTLDSQTTLGAIESLHRMILENQAVQHGSATPAAAAEIQRRFREMFDPSSPAWRTKVIRDSAALLNTALDRFEREP